MEDDYYYLKKDEEIKEGDEVAFRKDWRHPVEWETVTLYGVGAPDPKDIMSRRFRRTKPTEL